jgi:UDP-N-acetylmuramate-alanine ligase
MKTYRYDTAVLPTFFTLLAIIALCCHPWITAGYAIETAPRISDREIVERLTRVEEGQKAILLEMNQRFEAMEKNSDAKFEAMNQRFEAMEKSSDAKFEAMNQQLVAMEKHFDAKFEAMDKRFESMDKRFGDLLALIVAIVVSFAGIVAATIGFAVWDRRTAVKPLEKKTELIVEDLATHKTKLANLLNALREKAQIDTELATVLRSFSIL